MDIRFGPEQDIMSDVGFANMLYQILNLKPGAAMWAAPVCSTWIFCFLVTFSKNFSGGCQKHHTLHIPKGRFKPICLRLPYGSLPPGESMIEVQR